MITELGIDKDQLKVLLGKEFAIKVSNLIFEPKGEVSWSYIVECEDGQKYFLKIHKRKDLNLKRLQLLFDLHSKCKIENIAYPLKTTDGKLEIEVNGYPAVLFNFIEGHTSLDQDLSERQLEELGELLAKIHQSKEIIGSFDVKEGFSHPFKPGIEKIYSNLDNFKNFNPIQQETRKIYQQYKDIFSKELDSLERLAEQLKQQEIAFVNCHGEPSPNNIMIGTDERIYLIDWDEPVFAPKEKDLTFFGNNLELVLKGYAKYSADTKINPEVANYYKLRWNVGEIEDFGTRIFFEEHPIKEYQYYLNQLKYFLDYSGLGKRKI